MELLIALADKMLTIQQPQSSNRALSVLIRLSYIRNIQVSFVIESALGSDRGALDTAMMSLSVTSSFSSPHVCERIA